MNKNKALIKHEIRGMGWITLYFLSVVVINLIVISESIRWKYIVFLKDSRWDDSIDNIMVDMIINHSFLFIMFMLAGIVLLSCIQFIDIKSIKVGRFLKSLPFKSSQVFKIKVGLGVLSYTIPFVIFVIGILIIRQDNFYWISDVYQERALSELLIKMDSLKHVGAVLLLYYLILTAIYLFLVMMQYIVSNQIASTVIAVLVFHAPIYILLSFSELFLGYINNFRIGEWLGKGGELVARHSVLWLHGEIQECYGIRDWVSNGVGMLPKARHLNEEFYYYICTIEHLESKIIVCIAMALIFGLIAYWCSKCYQIENADILIGFKWARKLFIVGVTICSLFIIPMTQRILLDYYEVGAVLTSVFMIIGGVVGYIIAKKIANIGVRR